MNSVIRLLGSALITVIAFRIADAIVDAATEKVAQVIVKQKTVA